MKYSSFVPGFVVVGFVLLLNLVVAGAVQGQAAYKSELNLVYGRVDGRDLTLDAFLPVKADKPVPAIVEIHGGWWSGGDAVGVSVTDVAVV